MLSTRRWLYLEYCNHSDSALQKHLITNDTRSRSCCLWVPTLRSWRPVGNVLFQAHLSLLARQVIPFKYTWWLSCIFTKKHKNLWKLEDCASIHSRMPTEPKILTVSTSLRKWSRSKTTLNKIIRRRKSQLMRPLMSLLIELLRWGSRLQQAPELDVAAAPATLHSRETTLGLIVALNNCEITVEPAWKK